MKSEREYEHAVECLWGMHLIATSFNDEEYIECWLMSGIPDGTKTIEDVKELYPNDKDFDGWFNDLSELFCRLIARQTAKIEMPVAGTDFPPSLEMDAEGVVYVGQDIRKKV